MRSLKPSDFATLRNEIVTDIESRKRSRVATGRRTANKVIATARSVLAFAETSGYVSRNVARLVKPVKTKASDDNRVEESMILTPAEYSRLLEKLPAEHRFTVQLLFGTGVRIGELVALKFEDVDFVSKRIFVRGQLAGPTKTPSGRRMIELTSELVNGLRERMVARQKLGPRIFPLDTNNWRRRVWHVALKRAGLRAIRIHDARHSYASWMIAAGTNATTLAKQLGHKDGSLTQKVYSHYFDLQDGRGLGPVLEDFLARESGGCFSVVSAQTPGGAVA